MGFNNFCTEDLTGRQTRNDAKLWRPSSILGLSDNEGTPRRKIGRGSAEGGGRGGRNTLNSHDVGDKVFSKFFSTREVDAFTSRADVRRVALGRASDATKSAPSVNRFERRRFSDGRNLVPSPLPSPPPTIRYRGDCIATSLPVFVRGGREVNCNFCM